MPVIFPDAVCLICKGKYSGKGMTRHLSSCIPKFLKPVKPTTKSQIRRFFHLLVKGRYLPGYWLHLKVAGDARLGDLDAFLREIWLDCCGHLSAFSLGSTEIKRTRKIRHILEPGMELLHEYDFGSTTELIIKAVKLYDGAMPKNELIQILSRNEPPEISCEVCGKLPAVEICAECQWDGRGWLCQGCAETHECGEEMMLPVVNSPRVGVCGYTG